MLKNTECIPKNNQNLELILLDKGTIQCLKPEELKIISRHKLLVPDIFLIENLKRKETINKLSELENIYWVEHWSRLAKNNLLGQGIAVHQEDLTKITDNPAELTKQVKLAKKVARKYDEFPIKLLQQNIDLSSKTNLKWIMDRLISELETHYPSVEITENMIKTTEAKLKKRKSIFNIKHEDWAKLSQIVINDLDNKPIRVENRHLRENDRVYIRNKEWLDFACIFFQTTEEEKNQIFKRWEDKFHHPLKCFAPYAYYVLLLELTIALRVIKSNGSYKREIMRDLGYLYYANCKNVTFHTCDRQLKDTIKKIPFLKHIREKTVYFYNDEEQRPGELNKPDWLKMLKYADGT